MAFHPEIHNRRSVRLKGYDYAQEGMYFITICCSENTCKFGRIKQQGDAPAQMVLNEFGQIVRRELLKLPQRFPNLELDVFQIMPNHLHVIMVLTTVGAGFTPAQLPAIKNQEPENSEKGNSIPSPLPGINSSENGKAENNTLTTSNKFSPNVKRAGVNPAPTIGNMIGSYKSLVSRECLQICNSRNKTMGKLWQRNYFEHIIRNERVYQYISEYILTNPDKWAADKFYTPPSNNSF